MVNYRNYIDSDPNIILGKPKIKNTRISVELILMKLSDGFDPEEILQMYPSLKKVHIQAVLCYAAAMASNEEVIQAA